MTLDTYSKSLRTLQSHHNFIFLKSHSDSPPFKYVKSDFLLEAQKNIVIVLDSPINEAFSSAKKNVGQLHTHEKCQTDPVKMGSNKEI